MSVVVLSKRQKHHKEVKLDTKKKYEFSKLYLSEYCHFDGEDDVKFIVIDIDLDKFVITCMLNKTGKFFVQEFDLKTENGELYFEYNNGSQSAIKTPLISSKLCLANPELLMIVISKIYGFAC